MGEITCWYRPRFGIQGFIAMKKNSFPEVIESEILIVNTLKDTPPKKSKKKLKKNENFLEKLFEKPKSDLIIHSKTHDEKTIEKKNLKFEGPNLLHKGKNIQIHENIEKIPREILNLDDAETEIIFPTDSLQNIKKPKKTEISKPITTKGPVQSLIFKCPDLRCNSEFTISTDLLSHISTVHGLACKMPYCTFVCLNFQDYSDHFERVHCNLTTAPHKRGPINSLDRTFKYSKLV